MRYWLWTVIAIFVGCTQSGEHLVQKEKIPPPVKKIQPIREKLQLPQVDILIVVDDSGSMSSHQENLAENSSLFVDEMFNNSILNYRIGVLNSTTSGCFDRKGCQGRMEGQFVDRKTPNAKKLLIEFLRPGTSGDIDEQFFKPVHLALTPPLVNDDSIGSKDFYRPSAHLALIFVTDAEEQSSMSALSFYQFLLGLKNQDASMIHTYGAIVPSTDNNCRRDGWDKPLKFEEFFRISNGKFFNLCDPDFGKRLSELQKDLVANISRHVRLEKLPKPKTIVVQYGSQIIPNDPKAGWLYDPQNNSLVFGEDLVLEPQPVGTQVEVFFEPLEN